MTKLPKRREAPDRHARSSGTTEAAPTPQARRTGRAMTLGEFLATYPLEPEDIDLTEARQYSRLSCDRSGRA
jgi:hypothetical protein